MPPIPFEVTSFWESQSLLHTDVAIVGGGITGLSVACSLKEKRPSLQVTVFERSVLPYGASTRNAGFACVGSLSEVASDIQTMGEENARELLFARWLGLQITRKRLGDQRIGFEEAGGFELLPENERDRWSADLKHINALVADFQPDYLTPEQDKQGIKAPGDLYRMMGEGQVDTGRMMQSLERYALELGVILRTGSEVVSCDGGFVEVRDASRGTVGFKAAKTIVCSNAFAPGLIPDLDVQPGRGQVLITKPLERIPFRGNLHIDEGFFYLRNVGDRLLFGGGRNLDFETEQTSEVGLNNEIQHHLDTKLQWLFGEDFNPEVDMRWAGIMAFGKHKMPVVKELNPQCLLAVKLSGMGIALAGFIGEEVAEMV